MDALRGAAFFVSGLRLLRQPGLRRYVALPLLINTLLFSMVLWYGAGLLAEFINWLLPDWLDWLRWLLWPLFGISALLIVFYLFTLLANLIGAPFNGILSAAVERHLTGTVPAVDISLGQALRNAVPAMVAELRKLMYYLGWSVPFLLAFLIPVVQLAAPLLWAAYSAWMLAVEYTDYPASNHDQPFKVLRDRLRQHQLLVLGFGFMAMLFTVIPVINFLVMPAAVAGATALWLDAESENTTSASN